MKALRIFLALSWVFLVGLTISVMIASGINWPAVFAGDLFSLSWRAQFNFDFLIFLLLVCGWIYWREASKTKGAIYGALCLWGGLFVFAYLLYATYQAKGDMKALLLGAHTD